jgi:hypothetical protein
MCEHRIEAKLRHAFMNIALKDAVDEIDVLGSFFSGLQHPGSGDG